MAGPNPVRVVVLDILEEIDIAEEALAGRSFEEADGDRVARRAIERCIAIISEAARRIPDEILDQYPAVPWKSIKGVGNIIRHDYDHIDARIMWQITTSHLPQLKQTMNSLLAILPTD